MAVNSPESLPQTPAEHILLMTLVLLPPQVRTDVILQLYDEAAEDPNTLIFNPIANDRANQLLRTARDESKVAERGENRRIARSLLIDEQQIRAQTAEANVALTQGNWTYQPHVEPDGTITMDASGNPISNRRWKDILLIREHVLANPPAREAWKQWLKREERRIGVVQIQDLLRRVEDYELLGIMPPVELLPMGVRLDAAKQDLMMAVGAREGVGVGAGLREQMRFVEAAMSGAAFDPTMAVQDIGGGRALGRTMIAEYQGAFNRFREAYLSFQDDPDRQESILLGLIAGQLIGGSAAVLPGFYANAFKQIGRESSHHSMFFDALQFAVKAGGSRGYIPMDALFQALGSTKQEVLGFMDDAKSAHELWVEPSSLPQRLQRTPEFAQNPDQPLKFKLTAREMFGVYGSVEMLAQLGLNTAKDIGVFIEELRTKEGFWSARNNAFGRYIFHKMGYSGAEINQLFKTQQFPKLRRAGDLSKVTGNEITDFWDWVGEVALDKMILALTWIVYSRWDVEAAPLDLKRREILSMRGIFLAAYRLGYALGLPPEQLRNMIALFGSIPSIDRIAMTAQIHRDLRAHDDQIEVLAGQEAAGARLRKKILDETTRLDRPILSASRFLSRMAVGVGEFATDDPVEYRRRVREALKRLPGANIESLRLPELWKWRWFENVERMDTNGQRVVNDISQWRFVGNETCFSETQMRDAFRGIDFSAQLEDCGLRPDEVEGIAHMGYDGWKNFLRYANMGVLHWSEEGFTTGDKAIRYLHKVDAAGDVASHLMEVSSPIVPRSFANYISAAGGTTHSVYSDLRGRKVETGQVDERSLIRTQYERDLLQASSAMDVVQGGLKKASEPFSQALTFIPNDTQQRFIQATVNIFMDGHLAHALDSLVERLNVSEISEGDHFPVMHLYENPNPQARQNERNTGGGLMIPQWRMNVLRGEGFYSMVDPNDRRRRAEVISSLSAPLPELIEARNLLREVKEYANAQVAAGGDAARLNYLLTACRLMTNKGAFCWDTLISRRSDIPPAALLRSMDVGEEGVRSGVTTQAILQDILEFVRVNHPGSLIRGAKLGGGHHKDNQAFLIPQIVD